MGNENSTPVGQKSSTSLRATRERRTNEEIQEEDAATLQRDVDMSRREILLRTLQCQANNCNEEEEEGLLRSLSETSDGLAYSPGVEVTCTPPTYTSLSSARILTSRKVSESSSGSESSSSSAAEGSPYQGSQGGGNIPMAIKANAIVPTLLGDCGDCLMTQSSAKTLHAMLDGIGSWLVMEGERYALEESGGKSNLVTTQHIVQAMQLLVGEGGSGATAGNEEASKPPVEGKARAQAKTYFQSIDACVKNFFNLLHLADWRFIKEKNTVKIMQHVMEDPSIICVRGTTTIRASPDVVKNTIMDFEVSTKWDALLREIIVLEQIDGHTDIVLMKYVAEHCLLREARDFVVLMHWFKRAEDNSIVIVAHSIDYPKCPPQVGYTRGDMICCGYLISPLKDNYDISRVTQLATVNLNKVTAFMANYVVRTEPVCLHRLRRFIHERYDRVSGSSG